MLLTSVAIAAAAGGAFLALGRDDKKSTLGVGADGANKSSGLKGSRCPRCQPARTPRPTTRPSTRYRRAARVDPEYDDGSFGPVLVRLAWHASGTYDKNSNTVAPTVLPCDSHPSPSTALTLVSVLPVDFMEKIHKKFPWITYSDLWTLGGVAAVQELGAAQDPLAPGRLDATADKCTPDGRLLTVTGPGPPAIHFLQDGFNDQEIVALSGAHALVDATPTDLDSKGP